jgi:hypothetical protein
MRTGIARCSRSSLSAHTTNCGNATKMRSARGVIRKIQTCLLRSTENPGASRCLQPIPSSSSSLSITLAGSEWMNSKCEQGMTRSPYRTVRRHRFGPTSAHRSHSLRRVLDSASNLPNWKTKDACMRKPPPALFTRSSCFHHSQLTTSSATRATKSL